MSPITTALSSPQTLACAPADHPSHPDCGDSDHEPSIKALIAGLTAPSRTSAKPGFLIHLSGTALVSDWSEPAHHGRLNPHIWSDVRDLDAITSRPAFHLHRNVDKIIQDAAVKHGEKLKTAIVCPPDTYGEGRGPEKRQSVFLPMFFELVRKEGKAFYVGDGGNRRSWVHVEDLMRVYLGLVEAAVEGGGGADWGREVRFRSISVNGGRWFGVDADTASRATTLLPRRKCRSSISRRQWASCCTPADRSRRAS